MVFSPQKALPFKERNPFIHFFHFVYCFLTQTTCQWLLKRLENCFLQLLCMAEKWQCCLVKVAMEAKLLHQHVALFGLSLICQFSAIISIRHQASIGNAQIIGPSCSRIGTRIDEFKPTLYYLLFLSIAIPTITELT